MYWKKKTQVAKTSFIIALMILTLLSIFIYASYQKSHENEKWVKHTYEVLHTSSHLLSSIKDAETGHRGFIITGNPDFLEPLTVASLEKDSLLGRIEILIINNPIQQKRLDTIEHLIKNKYSTIYKSISFRKNGGDKTTIDYATINKGKIIMDRIRSEFKKFDDYEYQLLLERDKKSEQANNMLKTIGLVGILTIIIIFFAIFYSLFKQIGARKKHAEELFVKNEWFNLTLFSMGDAVIATDTNGVITLINKAAYTIMDISKEEAIGKHIDFYFDIVNEKTGAKAQNPLLTALKEQKTVLLEENTMLIKKDGSRIYIDDSAAPIFNSKKEVIGAVLIFKDITDKKKTEQERDLIFNISHDLIGIVDMTTGYFKNINPTVHKTLGYTQKEFLSKPFVDYLHPEDLKKTDLEVLNLQKGISTVNFINRYRCKDGTYKSIEWNVEPLGDFLYAFGRDITERERATQEIAAAHKKFYQILESNPVAIVISEVKSRNIKYVNDSFCNMSGFKKDMLLGRNTSDLNTITDEERDKILTKIQKGSGHNRNLESKFRRIDGKELDVLFSVESIELDGVMCFIGSFIDISERKHLENEIKQLNYNLEKKVQRRTSQLEKQKKFTDEILNKIPTEIAVYDHNEKYLYVNPAGVNNEDIRDWVIGKTDFDYCRIKEIDLSIAEKRHESFEKIRNKEVAEWIDEMKQPNGEIKYMLRMLHPIENDEKYILTGYDVTELKIAEQAKEDYIINLEQMMFMTSHKVRLPISNIVGLTTLLDDALTKEELTEVIGHVKDSITSLDQFTKELTYFIHDLKKKTGR